MAIRTNYSDLVQGTAVRKEAPVQRPYVRPEERKVQAKRPARRRVSLPVAASAMLALFSFAICAFMMVSYVRLRSELSEMNRSVTAKRSELSSMISHNDAEYNRIMASVDLSEIEAIARGELGMTYASEGQIVFYSGETSDYMRRYGN
jgi:predicted anti-sigma-YlaC factor YlaD